MNLKPLKDEVLEKYFQALFAMYGTEGWRMLMEDVSRMQELYDKVSNGVDTVEDLWFRKGQLDVVQQLLTHQARNEAGYAASVEEQEGEAEEPTGGVAKVVAP
jgi:hypothetical protein